MKIFCSVSLVFLFVFSAVAKPVKASATLTAQEKLAHLYNRLAFGPRPSEVDAWRPLSNKTIDAKIHKWIEDQMEPDQIKDASVDSDLANYPAINMTPQQARDRYKKLEEYAEEAGYKNFKDLKDEDAKKELRQKVGEENLPESIVKQMVAQKILRAVRSKKQLQEVLLDFWYNHFNIDITKGEDRWLLPDFERQALRKNIFGRFEDMLKATAHSPAMLFYLDNRASRGPNKKNESGLNENYAREILELHTLGVAGGYTQKDVTELARILTGWTLADGRKNIVFEFKDNIHDQGKTFFLGRDFPEKQGQAEGDRALEIIANYPSTAKFISFKLARYFVSDDPPPELIERMAKVFIQTRGDLKPVYRVLFSSKEFWSRESYQAKIKKPSQFVFSAIRSLDGDVEAKGDLTKILSSMGEDLYKCVPPTGYPDVAQAWVNPGAMVNRLNFSLKLAANRVEGVYVQLPSVSKYIKSPKEFINQITKKIMDQVLSPSSEAIVLKEFDPNNHAMMDGEVRPFSLVKATGLILGSPEFQRR